MSAKDETGQIDVKRLVEHLRKNFQEMLWFQSPAAAAAAAAGDIRRQRDNSKNICPTHFILGICLGHIETRNPIVGRGSSVPIVTTRWLRVQIFGDL